GRQLQRARAGLSVAPVNGARRFQRGGGSMTRWLGLAVVALLLMAGLSPSAPQSIVDSPHNLSSSAPGPVNALAEDRVCIFCHTPHGSRTNAALWNRRDSSAFYIPYDSPTLRAKPGQPTGTSKLCLS